MSAGFTPAPWSYDIEDGHVQADVGAVICRVMDEGDFDCLGDDEERFTTVAVECLANANLIAAAPDLYEALAGMVAAYDDSNLRPGWHPLSAVAVANAALAKARGES